MLKDTYVQDVGFLNTDSSVFLLLEKPVDYTLKEKNSNIWEKNNPDQIKGMSQKGMHFLEKQKPGGRTREYFPGDRCYFNKTKN